MSKGVAVLALVLLATSASGGELGLRGDLAAHNIRQARRGR